MWIYYGLTAAFFLSINAICRKRSMKGNAVFPVLFASNAISALMIAPLFVGSFFYPEYLKGIELYIPSINIEDHFYIGIKSMIMTSSWVLAFYALKYLPITIVTPIRSAGPFFTFLGAIVLYRENPTSLQWVGFVLIIASMLAYSKIGKKEGIVFKNNKAILAIVAATFLGACSGLYDKFLFQFQDYGVVTVQWWFFFYVTVFMGILVLFVHKPNKEKLGKFTRHWSIPVIGIFIVLADYFYFRGLQDPEVLIMLMSAIKRSQILFTVLIGGIIFKEKNKKQKMIPLIGVVLGVICLMYSS